MSKTKKIIEDETVLKNENSSEQVVQKKSVIKRKKRRKKRLKQSDIKKYPMNNLDHVISKIKANEVKYTIISVIVILIVFFIIAYIVFSSIQERTGHNLLKHGSLYIEFKENENGIGDIIDLVNVEKYSSGDSVSNEYEVTITNSSNDAKKYEIFIEDDKDMIEIDNCSNIFLDRSYLRYSINDGNDMFLSTDMNENIIFGTLDGKEKVTYKIKVWVSDTYLENPHYHGKIVVKQYNEKKDKVEENNNVVEEVIIQDSSSLE